jgi:O-methyltransferase
MKMLKDWLQKVLAQNGYKITSLPPMGVSQEFLRLHEKVTEYTMTSFERQHALYEATQYVLKNNIQGDIVECGVWRGGSTMIAATALLDAGDTSRTMYLYDTFTGMSEPTDKDINVHGSAAKGKWKSLAHDDINDWDYASLDEVKKNVYSTGYPENKIMFVEGKVEETIPATIPEKIALLRLDTDWYESTRHELEHLFPRLVPGGVLIIDDYGHWQGARQAVDEYFSKHGIPFFLKWIDYTGRIGVKIS